MGMQLLDALHSAENRAGLVSLVVGTLIALFATQSFILRFRRYLRFRHIPGATTAGWTRLWLLFKSFKGDCHMVFHETNEKYGK